MSAKNLYMKQLKDFTESQFGLITYEEPVTD